MTTNVHDVQCIGRGPAAARHPARKTASADCRRLPRPSGTLRGRAAVIRGMAGKGPCTPATTTIRFGSAPNWTSRRMPPRPHRRPARRPRSAARNRRRPAAEPRREGQSRRGGSRWQNFGWPCGLRRQQRGTSHAVMAESSIAASPPAAPPPRPSVCIPSPPAAAAAAAQPVAGKPAGRSGVL